MLLKISRDAVLSKPRSVCIQAHAGPIYHHITSVATPGVEGEQRGSSQGISCRLFLSLCYKLAHWALQRRAPLVK